MRNILAFATLALLAGTASAADNGIYLGAAIGADATLDGGQFVSDLDLEDSPYKLIAGFRPLDHFGVEVNYVDFGTARQRQVVPDLDVAADVTMFDAFAVGYLPISIVDLYAKAGIVRWDTDVKLTTILGPQPGVSESGTDFAWGAGAQLRFGSLAFRLEYESFEVPDADQVDMLSLGFTWTFL